MGYIDIRSDVTYRTTKWFDAVPARNAVLGEGKLSAKLTDEVKAPDEVKTKNLKETTICSQ